MSLNVYLGKQCTIVKMCQKLSVLVFLLVSLQEGYAKYLKLFVASIRRSFKIVHLQLFIFLLQSSVKKVIVPFSIPAETRTNFWKLLKSCDINMNCEVLWQLENNTVVKVRVSSSVWRVIVFVCSLPIYLSYFITSLEFWKEDLLMFAQDDSQVKKSVLLFCQIQTHFKVCI